MGFGSEQKVLAHVNLSFVPWAQGRYQIPFPAPNCIPTLSIEWDLVPQGKHWRAIVYILCLGHRAVIKSHFPLHKFPAREILF
jgi:hypothetical protein